MLLNELYLAELSENTKIYSVPFKSQKLLLEYTNFFFIFLMSNNNNVSNESFLNGVPGI